MTGMMPLLNFAFVSGHTAGSCQLIMGERSAVLIDCSLPFCAGETAQRLKAALGDRAPDMILLSHSHYDHIAGLPYIRELFPAAPVYAHPYIIGVLRRPGAVERMEMMCRAAGELFGQGFSGKSARFSDMGDIIPLSDGQRFPFDGGEMRVIFSPGHTRDSISVDFPDEGCCCLCETMGVKRPDGRIQPCFLSGYQDAIDSVMAIRALGKRRYLLPHMGEPLSEGQSAEFIAGALAPITESAGLICRLFDEGLDAEGIFAGYTSEYWSELYRHVWPYHAYEMNSRAAIKTVLQELRGQ